MLYFIDITFFSVNRDQVNRIFPKKEHYRLMENLTKVSFDRKITSLPNIYGRPSILNNEGMMPATCFSDTLLVKEVKKWKKAIIDGEKSHAKNWYLKTDD